MGASWCRVKYPMSEARWKSPSASAGFVRRMRQSVPVRAFSAFVSGVSGTAAGVDVAAVEVDRRKAREKTRKVDPGPFDGFHHRETCYQPLLKLA